MDKEYIDGPSNVEYQAGVYKVPPGGEGVIMLSFMGKYQVREE